MSIAKWDDSYRTGQAFIDRQHQELFRMVNELHDAIVSHTEKALIAPTLEKLITYTVQHFSAEEALMAKVQYPDLFVHRRKHQDLTKRAKEIQEEYRSGRLVLSITLSSFLADWLRHHIKEDDMALVKFVRSRSS
jgi:hemerythrin